MTDDKDAVQVLDMNHERPLDALLPDLAEAHAPVPLTPVHQRVLEVENESGETEWLVVCWKDPGGARALHESLKPVIEATMLAVLSFPPAAREQVERTYKRLRLVCFEDIKGLEPAVHPFGLRKRNWDPTELPGGMAAIRDEAANVGTTVGEHPASNWVVDVQWPAGDLGDRLREIQSMMIERMGDDVWGASPGGPSKLLANYVERTFKERITPDLDGLGTLELLLVQRDEVEPGDGPGPIRWIPPVLFQALADFIGVVATGTFGAQVQWALCEQDPMGLYPPPHFRIARPGGQPYFLPVALHLLRWCVMPLQEGEVVPTLAEWMHDQFDQ